MSASAGVATMPEKAEGIDIGQILRSTGPVVKCVVLRASAANDNSKTQADSKPSSNTTQTTASNGDVAGHKENKNGIKTSISDGKINEDADNKKGKNIHKSSTDNKETAENTKSNDDENGDSSAEVKPREVLTDLIDEIEIDTTPSKSMVAKTLGGPFTFLGQYEDEGVVLMVRNLPEEDEADAEADAAAKVEYEEADLKTKKLSELRGLCRQHEISMEGMLEKSDLVQALLSFTPPTTKLPPINPHSLQPPLHNATVRGDIVVMKVADADAEEEEDNEADEKEGADMHVPTNDEFFLDYTKDQYVQFASRTDIEEFEVDEGAAVDDEDDGGVDDNDDENGDGGNGDDNQILEAGGEDGDEEDEPINEEDKSAMFNLVMNEVLRQYREDNGRGPNTQELLDLRATIARELDVQVSKVEDGDWDKRAKEGAVTGRKIEFHKEHRVLEYEPHENEHNHHFAPFDGEDDEVDADDEDDGEYKDDDDDDNDTRQPPRKRLKSDPDAAEAMDTQVPSETDSAFTTTSPSTISSDDSQESAADTTKTTDATSTTVKNDNDESNQERGEDDVEKR